MASLTLANYSAHAEDFRTFNGNFIHDLSELSDRLVAEHGLLTKSESPQPDPLARDLGGFPKVHTYYAYQAGKSTA